MKRALSLILAAGLGALALTLWQRFGPMGREEALLDEMFSEGTDDCDCPTCTSVRELRAAGPAAKTAIDAMYGPDSHRSDPRTVH